MAKKVIATLKTGTGKTFTKCIKMVKSPKSGAYLFKEEMVHVDHIRDYFTEK
jgi:ABC-type histidine transport system ATPase subunit